MKIKDISESKKEEETQDKEYSSHTSKSAKGKDFKKMGLAHQRQVDGVIEMASYEGNIGYEEVFKFFMSANRNGDSELVQHVKELINDDTPESNHEAWDIIQDYTDTHLHGH